MALDESAAAAGSPRGPVALVMAVVGAMFAYVLVAEDVANLQQGSWENVPTMLVIRYVLAMGIGGGLAGWLLGGLFGRGGIVGWLLAALGAVLATLFTGVIGSAVGLLPDLLRDGWQTAEDLTRIGLGALIVPLAAAGKPLIGFAWIVLVGAAHFLAGRARRR